MREFLPLALSPHWLHSEESRKAKLRHSPTNYHYPLPFGSWWAPALPCNVERKPESWLIQLTVEELMPRIKEGLGLQASSCLARVAHKPEKGKAWSDQKSTRCALGWGPSPKPHWATLPSGPWVGTGDIGQAEPLPSIAVHSSYTCWSPPMCQIPSCVWAEV